MSADRLSNEAFDIQTEKGERSWASSKRWADLRGSEQMAMPDNKRVD